MPNITPGASLPLKGNGATVTVSTPLLNLTQGWSGTATFTLDFANVTADPGPSNAASLLIDRQYLGASKFKVSRVGRVDAAELIISRVLGFWSASDTGSISLGASQDLFLFRDAANTLALRNGVNAQAYRVYNTFTDTSNGEWGDFSWVANKLFLRTNQNGTGAGRDFVIASTANLFLGAGGAGSQNWQINQTGGHFQAVTDNTVDIGASGANRPRDLFLGRNFTAAGSVVGTAFVASSGYLGSSTAVTASGTTYTVAATDSDVTFTNAGTCTVTLPTPSSFTGRILWVKTTGGGSVISASSNVVPKAGGAAGTAILAATAGTWARLKSDGTNFIVTAGT